MPAHDRRLPPNELIWSVEGLLSPDACRAVIDDAERAGFEEATVKTAGGMVMNKGVRNNDRRIVDDVPLAESLFERIRAHVPAQIRERHAAPDEAPWTVCGLNERFRIYRYHPGQRFKAHFDGAFQRSEAEESALTFMIYLNDDFDGGETAFLDEDVVVRPRIGSALFFFHGLRHEGRAVTRGAKYVLRSDVMYRR